MKKLLILAAAVFALGTSTVSADNDRPISVSELPEKAQQFIRQHFPNERCSFAKMERELFDTTYEVIFTSSSKVEFLKNGDWKEVDCKYSTVPAAIIPQQIAQYVSQYYPDTSVVQIDRDKRDYEVKLTNGLELTFDLKFNLIDIDD
ncbi:MAG: PepSY-like domain-containing protein [Alistipes communis]